MSRRPHNPSPPGRPGPVRRDRPASGDQGRRPDNQSPGSQRPPVWPDVVDTVMLAKFTRQTDALLPGPGERDAPPEHPGESTRVLRLPGGKHGSGPMRFTTSSRRRTWVSRGVLFAILCVQAALTLRMSNTAFEDEALYLYSGHLQIAHLLHGTPLQGNYASYFSGAPVLYPVLGALADGVGGLAAARAVSLIAMLGTTALLYSLTRRMFNERVGLCAAVIFSVTESALFLGHLATYDAPSLFLLALASWIVVRTAPFRWPGYLLAAPPIALAVATKYAAGLFVPTIVVFSALAAWPYRGRMALIAPPALTAAIAALLGGALSLAGPSYLTGIRFTTTARFQGTTATSVLLRDSLVWGGLPFALAVIGAVAYTLRARTEPGELIAAAGGRLWRLTLGVVLTGTALLVPADQIHIHTLTSLQKHIGFGLFFAAPFAGIGLARIVGDHFRRAQVGIAIWGAALVIGMTQANDLFNAWPDSSGFITVMSRYLQPRAHYLVEVDEVPIYYFRSHRDAQPHQFTSTYFIGYVDRQRQYLTGNAGYVAAIKAGYFRVVAYNGQVTPALDNVLASTLRADPDYRLAATISNGDHSVNYYVWVRR
ncbi:MAG: ArnT family glycosyltransferase [Streptosporangiaceae bacterium]